MRTLILGFDAFDPSVAERLIGQGRLPNLSRLVEAKAYARFSVSNPPQSEVSWTSIATGLNPGGHGIFDFVHRDPRTYSLYVSLLPTKKSLAGIQFVPPHTATTIFDQAVRKGFPATVLWWPATFPARVGSPVRTIPGLGTPDIHGRLGVGTLFTTETGLVDENLKTHVEPLRMRGRKRYSGFLMGPARKKSKGVQETRLELNLDVTSEKAANLFIGDKSLHLVEGQWSPIIELSFQVGLFFKLHTLTRVILTSLQPEVRLYFLPLQLHPLKSPWPYGTPGSFLKQTWKSCGPFLTIGWPQDTTGLEEGCITDHQFLDLCNSIFAAREKIFLHHLRNFDEGILAAVFDSLDRIQHMFWGDRLDIVESWYEKLDNLVALAEQTLMKQASEPAHMIVVSDHGFANFDFKVHLNHWLVERGYLIPRDSTSGNLKIVDWSKTQAYAIGLNSIYLNLAGREGRGIVELSQAELISGRLCEELRDWQGPEQGSVVQRVVSRREALQGPLASYGPDILVGYSPGYRASSKTGLGEWGASSLEVNRDHWNADHCVDPNAVPGVLFSNRGLRDLPNPSYMDIPQLILGEKLPTSDDGPPPTYGDEEEEIVEERLKSLGYL